MYSQNDEDAIIQALLHKLRDRAVVKRFLEVGWHPQENNTRYLELSCGWSGVTVDAEWGTAEGPHYQIRIKPLRSGWIDAIVNDHGPFGLVSLDIDGLDYWVLQDMLGAGLRPQIWCLEYNKYRDPRKFWTVPLQDEFAWAHDSYFGASLKAFRGALRPYGYSIIHANGVNAFFIPTECA